MIDLAVLGMEALSLKSGTVIDLAVVWIEAISAKSGSGCNMGDRLGSFWDGSC